MLAYCQESPDECISMKFYLKAKSFHLIRCIKDGDHKCWPFSLDLNVFSLQNNRNISAKYLKTRRSENYDTPQPLDQQTNSPFIGQQVGNWSICHALWPIRKPIVHPRLYPTHISFIPSQSTLTILKYGYQKFDLENTRSRSGVRSKF